MKSYLSANQRETIHFAKNSSVQFTPAKPPEHKVNTVADNGGTLQLVLDSISQNRGEQAGGVAAPMADAPSGSAPAAQPHSNNVVQGKWRELEDERWTQKQKDDFHLNTILNIKRGFFHFLKAMGGYEQALSHIQTAISEYATVGNGNPLFRDICALLRQTYEAEQAVPVNEIIDRIVARISYLQKSDMAEGIGGDNLEIAESDDSDHGPDNDAPEENIDWSELTAQGLQRLPGDALFNIFLNLVAFHCNKAGVPLPSNLVGRFGAWMQGGVFTRSKFKNLIGLTPQDSDNTKTIVQLARKPNSFSFNGNYVGKSNGFKYDNVIYFRDGGGNIDFATDSKSIVKSYNKKMGKNIKTSGILWSAPVNNPSKVQMSNDLTNKEKGVMPSGKKVTLKSASRSQHFAIADQLYPNSRKGKWTWHHLSERYKMVLVDMKVHAKHGHNGGVHLWK